MCAGGGSRSCLRCIPTPMGMQGMRMCACFCVHYEGMRRTGAGGVWVPVLPHVRACSLPAYPGMLGWRRREHWHWCAFNLWEPLFKRCLCHGCARCILLWVPGVLGCYSCHVEAYAPVCLFCMPRCWVWQRCKVRAPPKQLPEGCLCSLQQRCNCAQLMGSACMFVCPPSPCHSPSVHVSTCTRIPVLMCTCSVLMPCWGKGEGKRVCTPSPRCKYSALLNSCVCLLTRMQDA